MKATTNYSLSKPELSDTVGAVIPALSATMDTIDAKLLSLTSEILLQPNGYWLDKLTGFMIQWGNLVVNGGQGTHVVFPKAFVSAVFSVVGTNETQGMCEINTESLSGFNIGNAGKTNWIAVGH